MRRLMIIFFFILSAWMCGAQEIRAYRNKVEGGYNFWLYVPESYDTLSVGQMPVVIFLHGSSLCGSDLNKVLRYGTLDAVRKGHDIDALVLAPQNPGGAPWNPHKIVKVLDWVMENFRPDANRVYVLGMSLGGYGTMDFVGTYPERVAAAMALCGGTTLKDVEGMTRVPFWIMHGTADTVVRISESRKVVSGIQSYGYSELLRYDWLEGWDHGKLARMFYLPMTYEWLFSHSLTDWPRQLNTELKFTTEMYQNAYYYGNRERGARVRIIDPAN